MAKHDFASANKMLIKLKESFDVFLKNDVQTKTEFETAFGKEVSKIFNEHKREIQRNIDL